MTSGMARTPPSPQAAREAKACCAAAYSHDVVRLVLGESYHPGGLSLTRRLAGLIGLAAGARVLDVASGPGATALLLAREHGVQVDGVDLAAASVARASQAASSAGLAAQVRFTRGDAERISFEDGTFDAVISECAFCTFPDKPTAAAELARVLRPGGRVGISDVTVDRDRLSPELGSLAGWVACIADARPAEEYAAILAGAGLRTVLVERHDRALVAMVEQVEGRLVALRLVAGTSPSLAEVDWDDVLRLTRLARQAVADGIAGYALLVAEKPKQ
ncbi:MAG: methyltransferase domain-containing protein [Actinomycetota bacterium]|nr:methyltransferase domain-containing protein [Actinomycetota bacterium]